MAAINDLISQIENPELRTRIQQEVTKMSKQKKFGLVFEEHLPENTPLYDLPIRKGTRVAKRDGDIRDNYIVISVNDGFAECEHLDDKHEQFSFPIEDLIAVAQFGEPIYPYLKPMDSICNAPDSELWHTLIQADNYHALQLLVYLYSGMVDCIYIDPPYNTGARDWKYNNDYVDGNDSYRHSKWLSFMQKRLRLAKKLLNPNGSVLIVTIDEKEYLHLGCLLEEIFPESNIQMVTSVISGKGVSREGQFSRVEEYIFFVTLGTMPVLLLDKTMLNDSDENKAKKNNNAIDFLGFRRRNKGNYRTSRPNQFYPVIVDNVTGQIVKIGDAITPEVKREDVIIPDGCTGLWPLDPSGSERIWSLVPDSARKLQSKGFLKVTNWNKEEFKGSVKYLASGTVENIENGTITIDERDAWGNVVSGHYTSSEDDTLRPRRVWADRLHNASSYGTLVLKKVIGEKRFDFPKSLYAVHDALRFFIANKPDALILDFFAGSGTTLHAVNLLNAEDGGHRRCIMVTNNEIGEEKENELRPNGIKPGDEEWERWGIARYVNWPRTKCSILGKDMNGNPISGDYFTTLSITKETDRKFIHINFFPQRASLKQKKALVSLINKQKEVKLPTISEDVSFLVLDDTGFNASILFDVGKTEEWLDALEGNNHITNLFIVADRDTIYKKVKDEVVKVMGSVEETTPVQFSMNDGFRSNACYFKLGFLDKTAVALGRQFREMLPLLWMKAGAKGVCPQLESDEIPSMLILPENHMAVLIDEKAFCHFVELVNENNSIQMVYLVLDSDSMYREMARFFPKKQTCQLYRDYLDNFRINITR